MTTPLPTRRLGTNGPEITTVGFGAWAAGGGGWAFAWGPQDDTESIAAIRHAVAKGVNWIDTAAVYGYGHSEVVVGRALAGISASDRPLVFTKCGLRWNDADRMALPVRDSRPARVREECEASLRRLGVETIDMRNLAAVDKEWSVVDKYAEAFQRISDAGITPQALIIFGLPDDRLDTFERTVRYLEKVRIPIAQFFIMTPYPGTPSGEQVWKSGRVFDERLSRLREPYVVFRPEHLSPEELRAGWWRALEEFYSLRSIAKRVLHPGTPNRLLNLGQNLVYRAKIKRGVHPVYFGA